ncbi:anti-sigma-D factor RsdA [Antrihabitans stalactiti]|uniref:Anti-sigma-D factor RsdA sigma factor binding region domain-containing protein n=1 Tax=Antrihabitans stalactiti TaxID=2584121 RepID=A0A848KIJ6_9NOCA|nr:anti-sigma-D factor RsdA [Antrihabitans stalactiti]NMN97608.1 hypothetical protein [Antrihabitans stalactiti]
MAKEGRSGLRNGDTGTDPAVDGAMVDIAAVWRDDALIERIASGGTFTSKNADEQQLATLLMNWRSDLLSSELPVNPDVDEIVAAIDRDTKAQDDLANSRRKRRVMRSIAGICAALALVFGTTAAFAYSASPSDPLWKVKQVVFNDEAHSTMAQTDAKAELQKAEDLISVGNRTTAREHLDRARDRISDVDDETSRDALLERLNELTDRLTTQR